MKTLVGLLAGVGDAAAQVLAGGTVWLLVGHTRWTDAVARGSTRYTLRDSTRHALTANLMIMGGQANARP